MFDRYPRTTTLSDGTSVTLRLLQRDDTERLVRLYRDVRGDDALVMRDDMSNPEVVHSWVRQMDNEQGFSIVAEREEELLGQVSLHRRLKSPQPNIAQLRLYVRQDVRQTGLGWHLLDEAFEVSQELKLEQLVMEMFVDNAPVISAFERRGFRREAILPVYQLLVMRYDLTAVPGEMPDIAHADQLPAQRDWPKFRFDDDLFEIPDEINLTEILLDEVVTRGWGNRPAIYYRNEIVTYDLLLSEVKRLASSLSRLGIKAGDPVLLHLPNTPQAIAANFAVQRLGALSVPTIAQFSNRELDFVAAESRAVAAITTADLAEDVRLAREATEGRLGPIIVQGLRDHARDEQLYSYSRLVSGGEPYYPATPRNRNELGLLLYTSADSGRPRGTAHRLDSILAALDAFGGKVWRVNEEDVIGSLAPLGFAQGFITLGLLPFRFGAGVALPTDPMADSGEAMVDAIRRHRVTVLTAAPTTYREILAVEDLGPLDLASLRLCSSGGEQLTAETYQAWEERFEQPIFEGFGTTEMLYAFISNAVGMQPRPGSLGRVVPGYQVKVVSEAGNDLGPNEIGHLAVRGPTGTLYWNNPPGQRRSVQNGWNLLPDFCYADEEDYFWFVARSDDLIKTRSYRIDPNEVEAAIRDHASVREVAVIGLPDAMRGQRPVAYAVLNDPDEARPRLGREIIAALHDRLADYKIPDEVVFVDELPRNPQGDLMRRVLREQVRRRGEE
ncbi:MAG TPA: GNAT family N-acetyltransferase [Ardenticatenaceae bacterium]|jgi:2-aminobenzoate-CoA ligase